jgi:hypothetical protein
MPIGKEIKQNIIKNAHRSVARDKRFQKCLENFHLNNREKEYQQLQKEMKQLIRILK